jgi:hypothetical protein
VEDLRDRTPRKAGQPKRYAKIRPTMRHLIRVVWLGTGRSPKLRPVPLPEKLPLTSVLRQAVSVVVCLRLLGCTCPRRNDSLRRCADKRKGVNLLTQR